MPDSITYTASTNSTTSDAVNNAMQRTTVRSTDSGSWSGTVCDSSGNSREVVVKSLFALVAAYTLR